MSNTFTNGINTFINNLGINTREINYTDINSNNILSFDINAILANDNAPADWSDSVVPGQALIHNPKRSLEGIIEERRQAIDIKVAERPSGDQYERLKSELITFVNNIVGTAAKLFATEVAPDSFDEAAAIQAQFSNGDSQELDDAVADLSARLLSLNSDQSAFDNFKGQLVYLLDSYKTIGRELKKAEAILRTKLDDFDKVKSDVSILLRTGDGGSEFLALNEAYLTYVKKRYSETDIDSTFRECQNLYKKWTLLRDMVCAARIAGSGGDGSAPTCGICLEDPVSHALANCGHTFCSSCLRQIGRTCPNCRKQLHNPAIKIYFT